MDGHFLVLLALLGVIAVIASAADSAKKAEKARAERRARWRRLELGMSESEAVALIGPPGHIEASVTAKVCKYADGGELSILDGTVVAWKEPKG